MTDEIPPDDERYVASKDNEIPTPVIEEKQGIESLPEHVMYNEGCPHTDNPGDEDHNLHKVQKLTFREEEMVLILYAKCSCGFETERRI